MLLEIVVISDALHAPDNQLLTPNVIHQRHGDAGRNHLRPGVEVLHYLSRGDLIFETFVPLDCRDFSPSRFSAPIPTEENSCARLFPSIGFKRMVHPIILHLPAKIFQVNGTWFETW